MPGNNRPKNHQILRETSSSAPSGRDNSAFEVQNLRDLQQQCGNDDRLRQYENQAEQAAEFHAIQYQNVIPSYNVIPVEYQNFQNENINNSHREFENSALIQNNVIYKPSPTSSSSSCFCRICHEGKLKTSKR